MTKDQLRDQLKHQRQTMPPEVIRDLSTRITELLLAESFWPKIRKAHIYNSSADWHEVDTRELIKQIGARWPVKIVSPAFDRNNPMPNEVFDLIIVPTLGFDSQLNRIGRGGGWYDKFLITQPQALKIGLAFQAGMIDNGISPEPHDVRMDMIITEEGIIEANHVDK